MLYSYKDMSHPYIHVTILHTNVTLLYTDVTILHNAPLAAEGAMCTFYTF